MSRLIGGIWRIWRRFESRGDRSARVFSFQVSAGRNTGPRITSGATMRPSVFRRRWGRQISIGGRSEGRCIWADRGSESAPTGLPHRHSGLEPESRGDDASVSRFRVSLRDSGMTGCGVGLGVARRARVIDYRGSESAPTETGRTCRGEFAAPTGLPHRHSGLEPESRVDGAWVSRFRISLRDSGMTGCGVGLGVA